MNEMTKILELNLTQSRVKKLCFHQNLPRGIFFKGVNL